MNRNHIIAGLVGVGVATLIEPYTHAHGPALASIMLLVLVACWITLKRKTVVQMANTMA